MLAPPQQGEAAEKGRADLLAALVRKRGVKFDDSLKDTMKDQLNGLGKLLKDGTHIWTGAEIEVVLKEAIDEARYDNSKVITLKHWNEAMDGYIPNTGEVERMTWLALKFTNFAKYAPPEYRELATDKGRIEHLLNGGTDYAAPQNYSGYAA
jgi:SpoVK/Ycf46/Vps4 family AAA+-type ATPase